MRKKITPFKFFEKLEQFLYWALIICSCFLGFFYNYDPVKKIIHENIFPPNTSEHAILIQYLSLIIAVLFWLIYKTGRRAEKLNSNIDDLKENLDNNLFTKGTIGIYEDVEDEMEQKWQFGQTNNIDILGYTLFSVAPKLTDWKKRDKLKNMTLNLHHLDVEFIRSSPDIDNNWENSLKLFLNDINTFIQENSNFLREKNVKINLFPYAHIPGVHGFKLGNGSVYFSIAYWNEKFVIGPPDYVSYYIKIAANDKSKFGIAARELFNNWIVKARGFRKQTR